MGQNDTRFAVFSAYPVAAWNMAAVKLFSKLNRLSYWEMWPYHWALEWCCWVKCIMKTKCYEKGQGRVYFLWDRDYEKDSRSEIRREKFRNFDSKGNKFLSQRKSGNSILYHDITLEESASVIEPDSNSTFSQESAIFPILSQFNAAHTDTSYLCNIHCNIIRPHKSCKISVSVKVSIRILYVFFMSDVESTLFSLFLIMQMMTLFVNAVLSSHSLHLPCTCQCFVSILLPYTLNL